MSDINPSRMIPLHVADQAVAACEKEIQELRAEVERLRKFNEEALAHIAKEERKSWERLYMAQAEVERLRKAGDALHKSMLECGPNEMAEAFHHDLWWSSYYAWNAAKEGKQP